MSIDNSGLSTSIESLNAVAHELWKIREGVAPQATQSTPEASDYHRNSFDQTLGHNIERFAIGTANADMAVGRMPPEPPTLRGRVGATLVRIVRRSLFWYSEQINETTTRIGRLLQGVGQQLAHLERERAAQRLLTQEVTRHTAALEQTLQSINDNIGTLRDSMETARRDVSSITDRLRPELEAWTQNIVGKAQEAARSQFESILSRALGEQRVSMHTEYETRLTQGLDTLRANLRTEYEARLTQALETLRLQTNADHETGMANIRESQRRSDLLIHQTRALLHAQESRISLLMRRSLPGQQDARLSPATPLPDVESHDLGPVYVAFEDAFRGSRGDIKERVSEYLPTLNGKHIGTAHMPVLDLGCGRGEWLEVLAENGFTALGVDSNEFCARECRQRGLEVRVAGAMPFLETLPDQSQGAITAFHVVEHIPFDALQALLNEAVRVLKPGGLLILETPNPANLIVGANTFYLDPTHLRPIPSELLRFIVEASGFFNVEARPLHPFEDSYHLDPALGPAAAVINTFLYGPRDYAIVAERP